MPSIEAKYIQLCIYRRNNRGKVEYLVLQRSGSEQLYPNIWQVITGAMRANESASQAARRELLEETGLKPLSLNVLPFVAQFYLERTDSIQLSPVFAAHVAWDVEVMISSEHQNYVWMPFSQAVERVVFPSHKESLRVLDVLLASKMVHSQTRG